MISVISAIALAASAPTSVTNLCTVSSFGPAGERFNLDVSRDGPSWLVSLNPIDHSEWLRESVELGQNTIKILQGDDGRRVLFGQARGGAGDRYFSVTLGADVVDGLAVDFAVDVMSYSDSGFKDGLKRLASANCEVKSGELEVEGSLSK